jgi:hypothetical protein
MPLEPGQWAEYRVADNLGRPSFVTHRIVGQEDDALWIETVTDSYAGKRIASVLIAVGEPRAPHRLPRRALGQEAGSNVERFAHSRRHRHFELRALVLRDDAGDVTELPPLLLKVVTFLWPYGFSLWWPEWRGEPQENVTVPAGRFAGCFRLRNADLSWNGIEAKSEAWFHPAVPLGGLVRQRSLDGSAIKDLVAFGVAGARSDP